MVTKVMWAGAIRRSLSKGDRGAGVSTGQNLRLLQQGSLREMWKSSMIIRC
jgi:hypothetical protein